MARSGELELHIDFQTRMSKLPNAKTVEHQSQARTNGASKEPPQAAPLGPQTVLALQRAAGNRAVGGLLVGGNGHTEPNGSGNGNGGVHPTYFLQRKPANGASEGALEQQADRVEAEVGAQAATSAKPLLVEDDAPTQQPGQMRKSEFLSALKTSVCAGADEELKGTIWSTMGCPYVERWFDVYANKDSAAVERALHKYAPETRTATSAEQYIPLVTEKVRKGVAVWKETGEVTGVPPEFAQAGMPGATFEGLVGAGLSALGGVIGGAVSKAASAVGGAISGAARAVGSGIASIGRAMFKAQAGGANEPYDAEALQAQLQGGHPLDAEVRGKMESAFGQDFSGVRVHADAGAARLSQNLNARAFTMGRDVAFGAGEYQPGTLIGDALIAHELAHVVQQGNGKTQGAQTKGAAYDALEEDADVAAVGAVATQFSGAQGGLDIGRETIPRLRSGLQLQRCSSSKKQVASPKAETEQGPKPTRFRSAKLLTRDKQLADASKRLEEVNTWALAEREKQNIKKEVGPKAVVGLDPKQKQNVISVIDTLKSVAPTFETKGLEAVSKNLDESTAHAKAAKKNLGGIDPSNPDASLYQMQLKHELFLANESLDNALKALEATNDSVDGTELADAVEKARGILNQVSAGKVDQYDGIDAFTDALKKIKEQIRDVRDNSTKAPKSIARIQFVLKSFVALNAPGFAGAPSAAEVKTFRGHLAGNLSEDFKIIFERGGGLHSPFELFETFANVLDKQLAVLDKMDQAKKPAKGPVPTQGEAEEYFKALKSKPNDEAFQAYEDYAGAFFYHRIVTTLDDMNVTSVADLYKRDISITGLRPLVCSGYAILGGHLLQLAGATLIKFVSAVRATNDDILNDTIDSGHAITHMKRKGKDFFVSNDLIVFKEDDAIGPDAVAWGNSKAPLTKASGPTNAAALQALKQAIIRKKEALEAKPKGKHK